MKKLEKIARQEQKAREKIAAMQARLKEIDEQRIEQENLQIVQQVRAFKLTREQLRAFVESGAMPASFSGAITDAGATGTQNQLTDTVEPSDPSESIVSSDSFEPSDPPEPSDSSGYTTYSTSYSYYNDTSDDDYYRDREDIDDDK